MSQVEMLQWIQSLASPWLDWVMVACSFIGDEEFYIATIPFIYFAISKRNGIRLAVVLLFSTWANEALKFVFKAPRPIGTEGIRSLYVSSAPGYSFPSGHSQGSATYWGYIATLIGRPWFYSVAAVLILSIMFSRLYLGVHWPIDVIAGLTFGLLIVALVNWVEAFFAKHPPSFPIKLLISIIVPLLLLLVYHEESGRKMAGFLMGCWGGYLLEERHVGMQLAPTWWRRLLPVVLGVVSIYLWRNGLRDLLPSAPPYDVLRYLAVGFWGTCAAPWLFVKFGLYKGKMR